MIEKGTSCYVYKSRQIDGAKLYKRAFPDSTESNIVEKWNTDLRSEAGCLTKAQWQERSTKWAYKQGWMLEAINGEVEVLQ